MVPTVDHVRDARQVVAEVADHTPLLTSTTFSRFCDAEVYLKAENLQRTGSFKIRGAINRVVNIPKAQRHAGVVAASAGNHAQGVALACRQAGVPCTVVMPKGASIAKVEATKNYGSQVVPQGDSFGEAEAEARRLAEDNRLTFIAAFDDPDVIAGQGTIALEVLEDLPDVEAVVVPVGGGGLISGVALVLKELQPRVKVYGVQVEAAPAATTAFHEERIVTMSPTPTIADGIAVGRPGDLTFPLMKKYVDDMVTVSEEEISHAMVLLLERAKVVVEGAGAAGLAALLAKRLPCQSQKVVTILSGGNVDALLMKRILDHGLAHAGRYLALRVIVLDRPGELARLLAAISNAEANVIEVSHHRKDINLPMGQIQVDITLETRDARHVEHVSSTLQQSGYRQLAPQARASGSSVLYFSTGEVSAQDG